MSDLHVFHCPVEVELGSDCWCGTVRLGWPAPSEGTKLWLRSSDPSIVRVHETALVATQTDLFPLFGDAIQPGVVTLTVLDASGRLAEWQERVKGRQKRDTNAQRAGNGMRLSAEVRVVEAAITASLRCFDLPAQLAEQHDRVCYLQLDHPAGPGGIPVFLTSSDPDVIAVPAAVTVPMNRTWVPVPVRIGRRGGAAVRVSVGIQSVDYPVQVAALTLWGAPQPLVFSTSPLERTMATARLTGPAPARGLVATLRCEDPKIATVPAEVTILPGASEVTFDVRPHAPGTTWLEVEIGEQGGRDPFYRNEFDVRVAHLPRWNMQVPGPILLEHVEGQEEGFVLVTLHRPAPAGGATLRVRTSDPDTIRLAESGDSAEAEVTFTERTAHAWVRFTAERLGSAILTSTDGVVTAAHTLLVEPGDPPREDAMDEPYEDTPFLIRHFFADVTVRLRPGQDYVSGRRPNDGDPQVPTFVTSSNPAVVAAPYRQDDRGRRLLVAGRPGEAEIYQQSLFDRGWTRVVVQDVGPRLGEFTLPPLLGIQRGQRFDLTGGGRGTTWFRLQSSDPDVLAVEPIARTDRGSFRTIVFKTPRTEVVVDTFAPGHAVVSVDDGTAVAEYEVTVVPVCLLALECTALFVWEVRLSGVAPRGGLKVNLQSTDPSVVTVPSTVVVPAGASVGEFREIPQGPGDSEIVANLDGVSVVRQVSLHRADQVRGPNARVIMSASGVPVVRWGVGITQVWRWRDVESHDSGLL